jgi:hypothetical protein
MGISVRIDGEQKRDFLSNRQGRYQIVSAPSDLLAFARIISPTISPVWHGPDFELDHTSPLVIAGPSMMGRLTAGRRWGGGPRPSSVWCLSVLPLTASGAGPTYRSAVDQRDQFGLVFLAGAAIG